MKNNKSNNQPLVSIIMNCYDGETYLQDSINSVLSQTYKNWELIFWDNKSRDKSSEIFKSYKDVRFKYFYADEHTTLYKARNLAIKKTKGDFIAFIDTDDLWNENKLSIQIESFNDPKIGVVFSNYWILKKNINKRRLYTDKKILSGNIYNELIDNYNIGILTSIIRKKFYLELEKKFDERFSIIGDYDLFMRLSRICSFQGIQKPLASHRLHGKNFSNLNKDKEIEEIETWLRENELNLDRLQIEKLIKKYENKKFLNSKIDGKFIESFNILINSKKNLLNIKNLVLLFIPSIFLKKLLWYYQDFNDVN